MSKPWLKSYPDGVPHEVSPDPNLSLRDIIEESCRRYADRPAFSNLGTVIDFHGLEVASRQFGAYLQQAAGMTKGDRIALMLPNLLQYPIALYGALRAGMAVVNVNPMYTAKELEFQLRDSGATTILLPENFAHTLETVLPRLALKTVILTRIGDLLGPVKGRLVNTVVKYRRPGIPAFHLPGTVRFPDVLRQGRQLTLDPVPLTGDDIAFLQYTGGTTGIAKGAVLSHGNLVANIEQLSAWLSIVACRAQEVVVTALPMYHIFSLTANCLLFSHLGCHNLLITDPRNLKGFIRELKRTPFTAMTGVNTLFKALLLTPGFGDLDFSRLRMTLGGGMAVQAQVADDWQRVTGATLIQAYGLTETSPGACINPMNADCFNGSAGLPLPSTEVIVRDPEGRELPLGEDGELCIRGPQVMRGYWHREQETRQVLDDDGWLRTGDIAHLDAGGYVHLVDRKKDIILVSGFNVYPNEVEETASHHPGVREVAAVSVPDPKSGEAVKLFVVREDPALDPDALIAFCRESLARYKVPRFIEFRDELPKTNVGKILRRKLREAGTDSDKG